jgi:predicted AlkP superfamily pyrophosphatase or phosphodiesterase
MAGCSRCGDSCVRGGGNSDLIHSHLPPATLWRISATCVNYVAMRSFSRPRPSRSLLFFLAGLLFVLDSAIASFASAYNGRPKLVVVIVIDQFRGDYLERYHDQFGDVGFRLLLDHGAYFPNCNYNYANTRTAPGHSTLFTGAYTNGHGIIANEWLDPATNRMVTSVEDHGTKLVGIVGDKAGASPHNLMADTLGDELKLATQGKSRVFALSLKDRAAILPGGFAADTAYWTDPQSGYWITSTYYRDDLPRWVQDFNATQISKYWNREWKDAQGVMLRSTAHRKRKDGSEAGFYEVVGPTSFANEYELAFARQLIVYENIGRGPDTDLLSISLSPNDLLGHQVGPDSPEMQQMALDLDRELADFFDFLGHQIGLADVWIALSADHGVSPLPEQAQKLHIPAANVDIGKIESEIDTAIATEFAHGRVGSYVKMDYPLVWLHQDAFAALHVSEHDAEQAVGEAMKHSGLRGYYTKSQLALGDAPNTALGREYLYSYSPEGSWYVMGVPDIYTIGSVKGTDHVSPYSYDTHVPLAFFGLPFEPGIYRISVEPVDLTPTLASLLGINAPTHSVGRVLTEALAPLHRTANSGADSGGSNP